MIHYGPQKIKIFNHLSERRKMTKWLAVFCLYAVSFAILGNQPLANSMEEIHQSPQYLYKILSLRNWQATQNTKAVQLSAEDDAFIHFSTQDQLEKIIGKYWADAPQYSGPRKLDRLGCLLHAT
jgi:hypothetical protein